VSFKVCRALQLTSGFMVAGAVAFSFAQQPTTLSSKDDDDSRPLSQIVEQFRQNEGTPISYEDPRYRNADDVRDVTERVSRATALETQYGPRIVVPRGRPMKFVYSHGSGDEAPSTLKRMVEQYAQLGGPSFVVEQDGGRLFVQPHLVKDAQGNLVQQASVLDTHITLPAQRRTGEELLEAICKGVSENSGFRIDIGSNAPTNLLRDYRTDAGFTNQPARRVLTHLLDGLSRRQTYVWDLYYDPSDRDYALNLAYVEKR
jgi:hypothetical protein